jgi:hypothetical protein
MGKAEFRLTPDGAYAIGSILFKGMLVEFVIDTADLERVKQHRWHYAANSYIATSARFTEKDASGVDLIKKREVYLHTYLLSPEEGKVVQHISPCGLDNRRANLRIVDAANVSASSSVKKKRTTELPLLCGIKAEEIPKHIWYVQANGYHRDRFAIEFKTEKILWKSTSSKKVSLQEKLEAAKGKLTELYQQYPHLDPKKEEDRVKELAASFEAILKASAAPSPPRE